MPPRLVFGGDSDFSTGCFDGREKEVFRFRVKGFDAPDPASRREPQVVFGAERDAVGAAAHERSRFFW